MKLREAHQILRQGVAEEFIVNVKKEMQRIQIPHDQLEFIKSAFAIKVGSQSDLNQYLKDAKYLAAGLPPETFMLILLKIIGAYIFYPTEEEQKDQHRGEESYRRNLRKAKTKIFKEYSEAIKMVSSLNPDPSRFDEAYLLKRAKENTNGAYVELSEPIRKKEKIIRSILSNTADAPIKKGFISVRLFIHDTYVLIRKDQSTLTDNKICNRLALLLTRLTGKKYIRQNVQNILARQLRTPRIPVSAK